MRPLFECVVVLFGPRKFLSNGRGHETGLHTRNELPRDEDGSQLKLLWRQLSICDVWMNYACPRSADVPAEGIEIISSARALASAACDAVRMALRYCVSAVRGEVPKVLTNPFAANVCRRV